jgi:hypothetical protein
MEERSSWGFLCVRGDRPQYVDVAEIRENPWSNRALSALLICMTESLVEEKAGKYVLTEMGRLYFSNPKSKKK